MNAPASQHSSTPHTLTPRAGHELMRGSRVMVAGAGIAGRGTITMLQHLGARRIVVADDNPSASGLLAGNNDLSIVSTQSARACLESSDAPSLIITSPGWRPDTPLLVEAQALGIPVIGDIEAAWLADQDGAFGEPRRWLAITGTNGKTTTTAMLTAMLIADGQAAVAVGNIGTPPGVALTSDRVGRPRADVLVAEVSSFQLHWAPTFHPYAGCVLNIAEDHLDWHGSFEAYAQAKARVLRAHAAVIPADEPHVWRLITAAGGAVEELSIFSAGVMTSVPGIPAHSIRRAVYVSAENTIVEMPGAAQTSTLNTEAVQNHSPQILASALGISPPGPAGLADACAAAALALTAGAAPHSIAQALSTFRVQAHRGQVVATSGDIRWIDNSKATNPHAAAGALRGQRNVVWIAGGQLKGAQVDDLIASVAPSLKAVVVMGVDRGVFLGALSTISPDTPVSIVGATDPRQAMREAVTMAQAYAQPGDSVILAPAAASLDMFSSMSQRGDLFAEYAMEEGQ